MCEAPPPCHHQGTGGNAAAGAGRRQAADILDGGEDVGAPPGRTSQAGVKKA